MPKQTTEYFASSGPVNGENTIAIHDQNAENRVDSDHAEGNCFPLCHSSFDHSDRDLEFLIKNKNLK